MHEYASKWLCCSVLVAALTCGVKGSICKTLDSPAMVCQKTDMVADIRYLSLNATDIGDSDAQDACNE